MQTNQRETSFEPAGPVVETEVERGIVEIRYATRDQLPPDAFFGGRPAFGTISASASPGAVPLKGGPGEPLTKASGDADADMWLALPEGTAADALDADEVLACHEAWRRGEAYGIVAERIVTGGGREHSLGCRVDWGPYDLGVAERRLDAVEWAAMTSDHAPAP